jgi:hypothetical protein
MIQGTNRRMHPRKVLRTPATVVLPGQPPRDSRTWDLGVDGMSLMSPKPIPPGTKCEVSFELPVGGKPSRVTASVKVLYCSFTGEEGFKVGTAFGDLDDESRDAVNEFTR